MLLSPQNTEKITKNSPTTEWEESNFSMCKFRRSSVEWRIVEIRRGKYTRWPANNLSCLLYFAINYQDLPPNLDVHQLIAIVITFIKLDQRLLLVRSHTLIIIGDIVLSFYLSFRWHPKMANTRAIYLHISDL